MQEVLRELDDGVLIVEDPDSLSEDSNGQDSFQTKEVIPNILVQFSN